MQTPRFDSHDTAILTDIYFKQKYDKPVVLHKIYMQKQINLENLRKKVTHAMVQFNSFNSTE